jgi:hypothetical protein
MHRAQGSAAGQAREGPPVRAARMAFFLGCTTLFLVSQVGGCNPSTRTPKAGTGDPLMGEFHQKKYDPGPVPPRSSKSPGVPPVPQAGSSGTNVSLVGPAESLSGGKPLAIQDAGGRGDPGWRVPGQKGAPPPAREDVKLQPPRTDVVPVPVIPLEKGSPAPIQQVNYPGNAGDYEQLQAALRARGVTWQRQETFADGFKFTCSVPNPANPDFSRIYEGTARDYRAAIRAVIEQIDRQRR